MSLLEKKMVAIGKAERIRVRKLASKVTRIVHHDSKFVNFMKTILNITIAFEKEYSEKLVATGIVAIVKEMMASDFLTGMGAQSYYRFNRVFKMMMRHKVVLPLAESLNSDDDRSKSLSISHLDDIGLYTATTEKLPVLIRA